MLRNFNYIPLCIFTLIAGGGQTTVNESLYSKNDAGYYMFVKRIDI